MPIGPDRKILGAPKQQIGQIHSTSSCIPTTSSSFPHTRATWNSIAGSYLFTCRMVCRSLAQDCLEEALVEKHLLTLSSRLCCCI